MTQKVDVLELKNIMNDIEKKTQNIIVTGIQTGKMLNPINVISTNNDNNNNNDTNKEQLNSSLELLSGIMQSGADEFEKKVGRPMTYCEMREMFG